MPDPVVNRSAARYIPIARPSIGPLEREAVERVMRSGWLSQGLEVERFEGEFAAAHGRRFGVACNSGTTAIQLALMASGYELERHPEDCDWVICPTMSMVAVPNAILSTRTFPHFIDSDPATGNMDTRSLVIPGDDIRNAKRDVIVVHLYGVPCEFQDAPDQLVIEDCAEAHYARFADGSPVGSRGTFATFSFYANKIVTTGEGGMVLTDSAEHAARLRSLRAHAFSPDEHFCHTEHALGCRMTDLQAAVGYAQHCRREEMLERRRLIAQRYMRNLAPLDWLYWQDRQRGAADWVFPILVQPDQPITRDHVRQVLANAGVETRTWFRPMHQQAHLSHFARGQSFPVADDLFARGFYLPLFVDMTDDDVDYICRTIASIQP